MGRCGVTSHGGNPAPQSSGRSGAREERKHLTNSACLICSRCPSSSLQRVPAWSPLLPFVLRVWTGQKHRAGEVPQGNGCPQPTLLFALR